MMGVGVAAAVLVIATGCRDSEASSSRRSASSGAEHAAPPGTANHIDGKNFRIDVTGVGECKVDAVCVLSIRLEALGDYHINKEYPYKFKAEDTGVAFQGTDAGGKNVFSKGAGDFRVEGEKVGTMTVKFKPAAKGNVTISGAYKMSVCSAQNCQLETQEISATLAAR